MGAPMIPLVDLLQEIRACSRCDLPLGPNPVLRASATAGLLIIGQAPGTKVHASGIPWDDASGKRLRGWLAMTPETFYDESRIAIVPMAFCYPGKGPSGDAAPPSVCSETWHEALLEQMPNLHTTLLVGRYAQERYLPGQGRTLTERVERWRGWAPRTWPMPHPSPRNQRWFRNHPWYEQELLPALREHLAGHGFEQHIEEPA